MKTLEISTIALFICICTMGQTSQSDKLFQRMPQKANEQVDRVKSALAVARIDPAKYEFSGQITATIYLNGLNFDSEDFCLFSVVGGSLRGVSRGMWFEPGKEWIHNHLVYSNLAEGDTIRFRLHTVSSDTWYEFDEYVEFKADMLISNANHPFILKTSHILEPLPLNLESSITVWPNPCSNQATIRYAITRDQEISIKISDCTGRVINILDQGKNIPGTYEIIWDTTSLDAGIYFVQINIDRTGCLKVVKSY